jgi:hypothetical protein
VRIHSRTLFPLGPIPFARVEAAPTASKDLRLRTENRELTSRPDT